MASHHSLLSRSLPAAALVALLAACGGAAPEASDESPAPAGTAAPDGGNLTSGCVEDFEEGRDYFPEEVSFERAAGVEVTYGDHHKLVTVTQPWDQADRSFTYLLVQCGTPTPEVDEEVDATIEVPIDDVVTMSTTYLPAFDMLGAIDRLAGVGNGSFVYNEQVREGVAQGRIAETGDNAEADLEELLELDPDVVMTYSFGDLGGDGIEKMTEAGLTVVLNGDYTEDTALGRAEWMKFVALFLNEEAAATEAFDDISGDYEGVSQLATDAEQRPRVFVSTPFEGTWYMPRGDSATGEMLADAGAEYVFAGESGQAAGTGNLALDIETVLERAGDADVWLNVGISAKSLDQLLAIDERFRNFEAFQEGEVYAETRRSTPEGLTDYYETGVARPDLVLADLVAILHPDVLPDHELFFYEQLPETAPAPTPAATTASG